ncbi:DNA-deoxyinosine glycosylase [Oenococcus sicerae]|uniref:DNA-deoxyinosine glycosylase n=1 Tax=Oenococcus sicerae TaxID=2203724 RepID=A0AAJ1VMB9_9LACO|nr:DNA-deoxyinosine glycosylase [Oenococcus sicerae]MDN6900398.1 DNA-deoxyinosine glycosylase [Oenococcus sicerae]QAS69975.1 DNA-deoxyinosine glycosylase [Oenococcus sicerae]
MHVVHPWPPLYDKNSKILLLGSLPSPKSLAFGFYYGSPQNIFWPTLAKILAVEEPEKTKEARLAFALKYHIAIWQTLKSGDIIGAQDATIKNPIANDFSSILAQARIKTIFTEGKKSTELFNKLVAPNIGQEAVYLPSTSPANRATQAKAIFMERWSLVGKALQEV